MIFYGHVHNGELRFDNDTTEELKKLSNGRVMISVSVAPKTVSERLRRYYWALCRLIKDFIEEEGEFQASVREVHERNKQRYMSDVEMDPRSGDFYEVERSHMDLTNAEMLQVCRDMQIEWSERGLYLPDPREGMNKDVADEADSSTRQARSEAPDDPAG